MKIIAEKRHVVESLRIADFEKKKNEIGLKTDFKPEIKRKRPGRPAAYPKLEEHLKNWVGENSENLKALSAKSQKKQIKEKAKEIAIDLDISAFGATDIWLKNFITKRCDELKKLLKNITLVYAHKNKPISTAIRPSSKILKISLHRNKVKVKSWKVQFAPQ